MSVPTGLGARPLLVVLDYDGTLAPIAARPQDARPQPGAAEALERLRDHGTHELAVLTGRRAEDVRGFLGLPDLTVVGLHGMQWPGEPPPAPDRAALERLRASLPNFEGRLLEDKGATLAVHYRATPDRLAAAAEAALAAVPIPPGWEVMAGKKVREFRPAGHGKGRAVERLAREHPHRLPVFVGDDITDEDGFAAVARLGGVGIKVGNGETAAAHRVRSPADVVELLREWARTARDARPAPSPPAPAPGNERQS